MERFSWTYDELMTTPEDVVNDLLAKLEAEADAARFGKGANA